MAKEKFKYRGKTAEELKELSLEEIAKLLPSRQRRTLERGLNEDQKKLLEKVKNAKKEEPVRTHLRDMIILPKMFGKKIDIHRGNRWKTVEIKPKMIGHYLGEFASTRPERVKHSGPGIGATRGTKFMSVE